MTKLSVYTPAFTVLLTAIFPYNGTVWVPGEENTTEVHAELRVQGVLTYVPPEIMIWSEVDTG